MESSKEEVRHLRANRLKIEIHPTRAAAGAAAAQAVADELRNLDRRLPNGPLGVVFATGAAQLETLRELTAMRGLPWSRISGFHLDEYAGLPSEHPASFRRYLRENLTSRVKLEEFYEIDGTAPDLESFCRVYAERLRAANPQLCLLGVGENGHLAFNEPGAADFQDPLDVKVVDLDAVCRRQQVAEGWFSSLGEVPTRAITVTIPALFRIPRLFATVPGSRKAEIVRRTLEEPISTACPATLLRTHPDATMYLDRDSAAEIDLASASGQAGAAG
jgi:glucosamine-6-phosphate deaminase